MRLINVETLKFKEFFGQIPEYIILSHTWDQDELAYADWVALTETSSVTTSDLTRKAGYWKILGFLDAVKVWNRRNRKGAHADRRDVPWIWADTVCIDKKSSAELTEAINSMWQWYGEAVTCFAHLSDVKGRVGSHRDWEDILPEIHSSRWFTRGWTLQELLAPRDLMFFNSCWDDLGWRSSNRGLLHDITDIPAVTLEIGACHERISQYSVADKMRWAANRRTTRLEDMAYSLLGLFGVNMPLLYGEGPRAFIRLQEEIIRRYHDYSIFAWTTRTDEGHESRNVIPETRPVLARSPSAFRDGYHTMMASPGTFQQQMPYSVTNLGVQLDIPLLRSSGRRLAGHMCKEELCVIAMLSLRAADHQADDKIDQAKESHVVCLFLRKIDGVYYRTHVDQLLELPWSVVLKNFPTTPKKKKALQTERIFCAI